MPDRDALNQLVRAWTSWDNAPSERHLVVALEDALRPIARELNITNSQLRDQITDHRREGRSITVALRHILNLPGERAA